MSMWKTASNVRERQEIFLEEETNVWPFHSLMFVFICISNMLIVDMGWGWTGQMNDILAILAVAFIPVARVIFKDDFIK